MNVVSVCPLRVGSLDWQTSRGVTVMTVVAKATYRLKPVTSALADEQEDPNEYETHWSYDRERSVRAPSDLAPYKPRPEVTLVGHAFAPRGEPVARLVARLIVGSVDKSIAVHADRSFSQEGALRHGPRFTSMVLRWEKAAGGPETRNPVGVTRAPDTLGVVTLPNLEPPEINVTRPDDFIEPVGFGPIGADWPARRSRLGRNAGSWSASSLRGAPLPEGIDPLYFLSAPPDQILDELRANERLILENLNPEHARLVTSLPGWEPRAFVERPGAPVTDLPMACDTLWIDTDRSICTLTWRGQITQDHATQDGRVVVAMETVGRPLAWSAVEELAAQNNQEPKSESTQQWPRTGRKRTETHDLRAAAAVAPRWPSWLPSADGATPPIPGDVRLADFRGGPTGTVDGHVPKDVIEAAVARAEATRARSPLPSTPSPPAPHGPPPAPEASPPAWLRAPSQSSPPPALVRAATIPAHELASRPATPWAAAPMGAPLPTAAPVVPPPRAAIPSTLGTTTTARAADPPPARAPAAVELQRATERGVTAASNAAAAGSVAGAIAGPPADRPRGEAPAAPAREPAREHVDLLWFDPTAVPRILADKVLGEGRPERQGPRWVKEASSGREPAEARDRRDILAALSHGRPCDEPAGLDRVANVAYQDDGTFTAPLVLVAGELSVVFDEVESLRALLVVTAPFRGADKKLREVVDGATEALKAEGRLPGDIAAGLSRRVEEAFTQGQRSVAPGYLDTSVERILLDDRRYARKTLFGEPRLRALLAFPGGGPPVPTYLPEALATRLPLFRRFKARAIVELRPQEDQYETHADALLVLALGRVVRRGGG